MLIEIVCASVLAVGGVSAPKPQVHVTGNWQVEVSAGTLQNGRKTVNIAKPVKLDVAPADVVEVKDEVYGSLPVFNPDTAGWIKGATLKGLVTVETSAADMLYPESVVVKSANGETVYQRGTDYEMDEKWGSVGRLASGAIKADEAVKVSYVYGRCRLDSIVADKKGTVSLVQGTPHTATAKPPVAGKDSVVIANVWVPGQLKRLTSDHLYPIIEPVYPEPKTRGKTIAAKLLPKTWEKLQKGQELNILAWGDSVTAGGQASDTAHQYQYQFQTMLQKKFPKANVKMTTVAWGGRSSDSFMAEPSGSDYNFQEKVVDPHPDLIIMEFVNDAYLTPEQVEAKYSYIKQKFDEIGAEWIILTPHYVRPDWMGQSTVRIEKDPRSYVTSIRDFSKRHNVALADASLRWGHLLKEGIPFVTLFSNSINHPDDQGHLMFALSLMELFGGNKK